MSKVTPRPWKMFKRGRIGPRSEPEIWIGIDHNEYGELSHMTVRAGCDEAAEVGNMEANAAHIVKAVNMHEELVAGLRQAVDQLKIDWNGVTPLDGHSALFRKLEAILAKAEGRDE